MFKSPIAICVRMGRVVLSVGDGEIVRNIWNVGAWKLKRLRDGICAVLRVYVGIKWFAEQIVSRRFVLEICTLFVAVQCAS